MTLGELMGPEAPLPAPWLQVPIVGLTADSRAVKPGYLFAALPGSRTDGARYIADALARGAAAILMPQGATHAFNGTPVVEDADPRRALALIAARFFGAQPEDRRRRHRHQRQDFGRLLRPPALGAAWGSAPRASARSAWWRPSGTQTLAHTTPDPIELHAHPRRSRRALASPILRWKLRAMGSSSAASTACGLRPAAFTNISPRPSRLSPELRGLFQRQAPAVRRAAAARAAPP